MNQDEYIECEIDLGIFHIEECWDCYDWGDGDGYNVDEMYILERWESEG